MAKVSSDFVSGDLHFRNAAGNTVLAVRDGGNVELVTATPRVLTEADNGKTFFVDVADCVFTLPATFAGGIFRFIVRTLSTVTGCSISPAAADSINGGGLTSVDDKDLINTAATDAEGDSVTLVADGAEGWYIAAITGTWAKEA
jgi:hypothetical protein